MKHQDRSEPDPSPFIGRLSNGDAFYREAAAWSLGEIGSPRAARPLAGLLLREVEGVRRSGYLANGSVVVAVSVAIRRIGAVEALYALVHALSTLTWARLRVDRATVEEIVESIAEVGGPNAVREAADRVAREARRCGETGGLDVVSSVLMSRLSLCGDAALKALRRLSGMGPESLRRHAVSALETLES